MKAVDGNQKTEKIVGQGVGNRRKKGVSGTVNTAKMTYMLSVKHLKESAIYKTGSVVTIEHKFCLTVLQCRKSTNTGGEQ